MIPSARAISNPIRYALRSFVLALATTMLFSSAAIAQSQHTTSQNATDGWQPKNGPATAPQPLPSQVKQTPPLFRQARFHATPSRSFSRPWTKQLNGIASSYRVAANQKPTIAMPADETLEVVKGEPSVQMYEADGPMASEPVSFENCWALCGWHWWENLTMFGGVNSFKGPADQGINGNNGFNTGLNFALPLSYCHGIGMQMGVNFVQSDLSGSELDANERSQTFVTAGIFHRTQCGWQYGAVVDFLQDHYYVDMNISQIRTELSWVNGCGREWGVRVAASSRNETALDSDLVMHLWEPTDQFVLFYRRQLQNGGEAQFWAGGTSESDGLLGGEFTMPISKSFAVTTAATYLIPEEGKNLGGHATESWGLTINLVWYPGCRAYSETSDPFRPLFRVADNTSLLIDQMVP